MKVEPQLLKDLTDALTRGADGMYVFEQVAPSRLTVLQVLMGRHLAQYSLPAL